MSTSLLGIIKEATMNTMANSQLCDLRYGKVVGVSPLKVQITNQFVLPQSLLVVPQHLTTYEIECTVAQSTEQVSGKTEESEELEGEIEPISTHTHKFSITQSSGGSKQKITVHNALKLGDKVALLREQGGQSYFILDRI